MSARISACPACDAAPAAQALASRALPDHVQILLALPTAHCAACISDVERVLSALPKVHSARVNLTQKRVTVETGPDMTAAPLITALAGIGYPAHELDPDALTLTDNDRQGRDLLMRLAIAGFAMMNIMLLSVAVWSGAEQATRDLFHWISAAIALPTLAFCGQPFFSSAWASLKARRLGMDVPISLALILASTISLFETAMGGHHAYFDAAVSLCFFLLIGRYLEYRSRAAARSAAEELAALEVPRATRLQNGAEAIVPLAELVPGDLILVRPGARMPVDGVIAHGQSELDRSLLTGETAPVVRTAGELVSAGEINLTGPLHVQVTAAGRHSSLARMAELVAHAEGARSRYRGLADRMARGYSPVVHLMAFGSFLFWLWHSGGDLRLAVNVAAAVLIITCPCALALAVPAVVASASGRLFRMGLLIKHGTALERLAEVDTVIFDKTGTLTEGRPVAHLPMAETRDLQIALALALCSQHPHAQALVRALQAKGIAPVDIGPVVEVPGKGLMADDRSQEIRLGRADWVSGQSAAELGSTSISQLGIGGRILTFAFHDTLRSGAADLVAKLRAVGCRVILLSGDQPAPVARLAAEVGIAEWQASVLPSEKAAFVAGLARQGAKVLMVGDGLNDTAALATAHVSISPASALDAARAASDIVLLGPSLAPIADALHIGRLSRRRIKQNFGLSLGYNIIAVPIALAGLATPLIAAIAMSSSSITVSLNALRLK